MTKSKLIAMAMAFVMVTSIAAPAAAAQSAPEVSVEQTSEDVTVTITGDVDAAGATVAVSTVDDNATYAGEGEYTADENGTVSLPLPSEPVAVQVVAESANGDDPWIASTEAELTAAEEEAESDDGNETEDGNNTDAFGQEVSAFIATLDNSSTTNESGIGHAVSAFVLANNPAADKIPEHAKNKTRGPPDKAGKKNKDKAGGPPDHAKGNKDKKKGKNKNKGDDEDDEDDEEEEESLSQPGSGFFY